jgi:hypothetical protein
VNLPYREEFSWLYLLGLGSGIGAKTMKSRHVEEYRASARATLSLLHLDIGQDFHALSSSQVEDLLAEADRVKYRKPKNANGSRGRYFYQLLQRRAQSKD